MNLDQRAREIYQEHYWQLCRQIDRAFAVLLAFQWLLGIVFALWISPQIWSGDASQRHLHVYAAVFLGGLLVLYPVYCVRTRPGEAGTRYAITVAQILFSTLFIHLTGGRIETHFHIFGSLAFLAFYRDWRVILIGTVITTSDHLLRGMFWPMSVYGVLSATPWRALEHAAWVLFEDSFLLFSCVEKRRALESISRKQAALENTVEEVERRVEARTQELQESYALVERNQRTIIDQERALVSAAKMSALGEMAGGVAHEINNPLATIKTLASQLEMILEEDETLDRRLMTGRLSVLIKTTDRIAKIVLGLRSFSRDGSKDPFQTVQVHRLVSDTLDFCREKFRERGVDLVMGPADPRLAFEGRGTEVSQVLLNLLNNAYDELAERPEKWVRLEVHDLGEKIQIRVTDSGGGLSPETRSRLFQPFFTTKQIGQGVGLGLSVSLGIIRSHHGELLLDDQNAHTSFVIRIPKKQPVDTAA